MRKVFFGADVQVCKYKDREGRDAAVFQRTTNVAPVTAYTWNFEPAVSSREGTSMVAAMLHHSGAQNRQKCRKDKADRYFAAHMAFPAEISLEEKEKEEKVKRGITIVELQGRVLLHLGRDIKLEFTVTQFGISFLLFPCYFHLWVVRETKLCLLFYP
ncbi:hypothetical protein GQ457_13G017420 [Hibiscus cannabinus]